MTDGLSERVRGQRRSLVETLVISALTAVVALASGFASFANVVAFKAPDAALRVAPHHFEALAVTADRLISSGKVPVDQLVSLARGSLGQQAINPRALRLLGTVYELKGNLPAANAAFDLSERTSRRDFGTQLWMIERAVRREDLAGAFDRYDAALRTNLDAKTVLFPILTRALTDPELTAPFAVVAAKQPLWLGEFMRYYLENGGEPGAMSRIMLAAGTVVGNPRFEGSSSFVLRSIAVTDPAAGVEFYRAMPRARPEILRSLDFQGPAANPRRSPIAWQLENGENVQAAFEMQDDRAVMYVSSSLQGDAIFASKLLQLPQGRYTLFGRTTSIESQADRSLVVRISCVDGASTAPVVSGELSSDAPLSFDIAAASCRYQRIALVAVGEGTGVAEWIVHSLALARIAPTRAER